MTCSISWPRASPAFPWQLAGCRLWSVMLVRIYLETIAPSPQVPHLFQKVRSLQGSDLKKSQKPSRLWAKEPDLSDWQHGIWLQLSDIQWLWLKREIIVSGVTWDVFHLSSNLEKRFHHLSLHLINICKSPIQSAQSKNKPDFLMQMINTHFCSKFLSIVVVSPKTS